MASNSEGVVFSRVVKVRERKTRKTDTVKRGRALDNQGVSVYLPIQANRELGINDKDLHLVMAISPTQGNLYTKLYNRNLHLYIEYTSNSS